MSGATLDYNVDVSVSTSAAPVSAAGFGVPIYAADAANLGVGFTERVRFYNETSEAAADSDLSAVELAAVTAAFSQSPRVSTVGVARIEADVAQVYTYTFTGSPEVGDVISITIDGELGTHVVDSTVLNDEVSDLRTALGTALTALDVTVGGADAVITVTADVAGDEFTQSSSIVLNDAGNLAVGAVETAANVSISTELAEVRSESDAWYGLGIFSRVALQIQRAAAWVQGEAGDVLFIGQSADADVLTTADTDIGNTLNQLSYSHTAIIYHATSSQFADMAWLGMKLEADPDQVTTTWKYATLAGVTLGSLTPTERTNALANHCSVYLSFFGNGGTGDGKLVNDIPIDVKITADWTKARIRERVAQKFTDTSNANSKVPYTDPGIGIFVAILESVLKDGENIGHFAIGSTSVTFPLSKDVSTATKASRELTLSFIAVTAGAIESVTITGNVSVD
jgi:hypothetical protein